MITASGAISCAVYRCSLHKTNAQLSTIQTVLHVAERPSTNVDHGKTCWEKRPVLNNQLRSVTWHGLHGEIVLGTFCTPHTCEPPTTAALVRFRKIKNWATNNRANGLFIFSLFRFRNSSWVRTKPQAMNQHVGVPDTYVWKLIFPRPLRSCLQICWPKRKSCYLACYQLATYRENSTHQLVVRSNCQMRSVDLDYCRNIQLKIDSAPTVAKFCAKGARALGALSLCLFSFGSIAHNAKSGRQVGHSCARKLFNLVADAITSAVALGALPAARCRRDDERTTRSRLRFLPLLIQRPGVQRRLGPRLDRCAQGDRCVADKTLATAQAPTARCQRNCPKHYLTRDRKLSKQQQTLL